MIINLPENISDITLKQYMDYNALGELTDEDAVKHKIAIFGGVPVELQNKIRKKDSDSIINQINEALKHESNFRARFTLNGIEFGFIPNFDKITAGEWGDISRYNTEIETLHRLMAILFRPIDEVDNFGNYKLQAYHGTDEHAELMLETPMDVVHGGLIFFYNLAKELQTAILRSTEKELKKERKQLIFSRDGDGMPHSMN